ncbi:monovalent cation/H(+) antiporter subunit G [Solemya elarraichensis gill symbiont]|uniref:Sodium:proton antiporter n=1 Tax=Solemya elarraichensis gill symbiont TaxID=1918949 RepID=A0A1T2L4M1_9GAMM|nr:monovalent cation/H(+) antiporter subunit G [Solemya elarraichensis gill symbiont]OOZ40043.1 sodium:proton antiporter [Solemya elarraichensis gill symbiont]
MQLVTDILSWFFLLSGGFAVIVGSFGLMRFPDFYTRLHAAGITDTFGAAAILIGLSVQAGLSLVTVKLVLITLFILLTSPTSTHALAKSALHGQLKPLLKEDGGASSNT